MGKESNSSKKIISFLKNIPIDLGQEIVSERTKGKQIALSLVRDGKKKKALDVGCREGFQSLWLEKKGYKVVSIDIEKRYNRCRVVNANRRLPFRDKSFDLIWCSEVIEHLEKPEKTIKEFRRILKKGGEMIITTPNSYFWIMKILNVFGLTPKKLQREDHKHFFSIGDIRMLFSKASILGYFPYVVYKKTIRNYVGVLSPTFVIVDRYD